MYNNICEICGKEFTSRGAQAKYCDEHKKEVYKLQGQISYFKRKGYPEKAEKLAKELEKLFNPEPKSKKTYCPLDNCPFRCGNRPCLFYIERKDGTATCPNIEALNKYRKQQEFNEVV